MALNKGFVSGLLVMILLISPLGTMALVTDDGAGAESGRLMTTPDLRPWEEDLRMTNGSEVDQQPFLSVDADGKTNLIWAHGSKYNIARLSANGSRILLDKELRGFVPIVQYNGQFGKAVGTDIKNNVHFIRKLNGDPVSDIIYDKYTSAGSWLLTEPNVTVNFLDSSGANMVVSPDGTAYIIFEYISGWSQKIMGLASITPGGNLSTVLGIWNNSLNIEGETFILDNDGDLRVLANVWDGPSQGVWAFALNGSGKIVDGKGSNFLYRTGNQSFPFMPKMTVCPDNSVHLLRFHGGAANGGKLTYMKLNNENRIVAGEDPEIVIAEDAKGPGDIACDSYNNIHVVHIDGPREKLYYTEIVSGAEYDTLNPIKLTSQGSAKEATIVVGPLDDLRIAWVDDRDGNDEIYYKYAPGFGLMFKLSPMEEAKLKYIHPEEFRSNSVILKNLEAVKDNATLEVRIDYHGLEDNGWGFWLEEENVSLDAYGSDRLYFDYQGPITGQPGDFIDVTIKATSWGNPKKNATITFRIYLVVEIDVRVDCADNVHITGPGQTTEFVCTVRNTGDVSKAIMLEVDGPDDWDYSLSTDELTLEAKECGAIFLFATPHFTATADSVGSFFIRASIKDLPHINDTSAVHAVVQPYIFLEMELEQDTISVEPGGVAQFKIIVRNIGNMAGSVTVILEIVSGVGEWNVILDRTSMVVSSGGEEYCMMTVLLPEDSKAGDRLTFNVTASDEAKTLRNEVRATVIIKDVHDMEINFLPSNLVLKPGGAGYIDLELSNKGNIAEILNLTFDMVPKGWFTFYSSNGHLIDTIVINPGETMHLKVELRIPADILAGSHNIVLIQSNGDGFTWTQEVNITVEKVHEFEVSILQSKKQGHLGDSVSFSFKVKNLGNGPEEVLPSLDVDELPRDWTYRFRVDDVTVSRIDFDVGEDKEVDLEIAIPEDTKDIGMTFSAYFKGSDDNVIETILQVFIETPELEISAMSHYPSKMKARQNASFMVSVTNAGSRTATNILVAIYIIDELLTMKSIPMLLPGSTEEVVFDWLPIQDGLYDIWIRVDPENDILETNEDDNDMVVEVKIKGKRGAQEDAGPP
jgi:uncharacterized membrane protein